MEIAFLLSLEKCKGLQNFQMSSERGGGEQFFTKKKKKVMREVLVLGKGGRNITSTLILTSVHDIIFPVLFVTKIINLKGSCSSMIVLVPKLKLVNENHTLLLLKFLR